MFIDNLVFETSENTGTGDFTLVSETGWRNFNTAFGVGGTDVFFYFIRHTDLAEWEVGSGHLSDATTLVRDTIIASSNSNALVDFSVGQKDIVNDIPASLQTTSELKTVAISGDTTISQTTHHNKILEVSANAVLTLPNSLTAGTQFLVMPTATGLTVIVETDQAASDTLNGVTDGRFLLLEVAYKRVHVYVSSTGVFYIDGAIRSTT